MNILRGPLLEIRFISGEITGAEVKVRGFKIFKKTQVVQKY